MNPGGLRVNPVKAGALATVLAFALLSYLTAANLYPTYAAESAPAESPVAGAAQEATPTPEPTPLPEGHYWATVKWSDGAEASLIVIYTPPPTGYVPESLTHAADVVVRVEEDESPWNDGNPYLMTFQRPGFGDIEMRISGHYAKGHRIWYRPDPPAPTDLPASDSGDSPTVAESLTLDLEWADGEKMATVTLTHDEGFPDYSDLSAGPNTAYWGKGINQATDSWWRDYKRTQRTIIFQRPKIGGEREYARLRWWYDTETGIYYRFEEGTPARVKDMNLEWSDGEKISVTMRGSPTYQERLTHSFRELGPYPDLDTISHGPDTTVEVIDYDYETIFRRPGFGAMQTRCGWYRGIEGLLCRDVAHPDPSAEFTADANGQPVYSRVATIEWDDGESVTVTLSRDADGKLEYDRGEVPEDVTVTNWEVWYSETGRYLVFHRPGYGFKSLGWYYDSEVGGVLRHL